MDADGYDVEFNGIGQKVHIHGRLFADDDV